MSLRITRAGILDTIQDGGRYGYQHLGINPGGAMDRFSAALANALLGKDLFSPVLEMHFPAAQILFEKDAVICLAGADFSPAINDVPVSLHQPYVVKAGAVLSAKEWKSGARCYLSLLNELQLTAWLNSFSTNLKAGAGGVEGRRLQKGDQLFFNEILFSACKEAGAALPWKYNAEHATGNRFAFIAGPEWDWLSPESKKTFLTQSFLINSASDRMGYRLNGVPLEQARKEQLVSSAVSFGTVQLLPNGQLIILMADHQTTGGYPRIANLSTTHLSALAQKKPGESIGFVETDLAAAQEKLVKQHAFLQGLQQACYQKMQNWLYANRS